MNLSANTGLYVVKVRQRLLHSEKGPLTRHWLQYPDHRGGGYCCPCEEAQLGVLEHYIVLPFVAAAYGFIARASPEESGRHRDLTEFLPALV